MSESVMLGGICAVFVVHAPVTVITCMCRSMLMGHVTVRRNITLCCMLCFVSSSHVLVLSFC